MRFLTFTTDIPPIPRLPTSGTALRTYGLIQGLRSHGHDVIVSVPRFALESCSKRLDTASLPRPVQRELERLRELAFDGRNQRAIVDSIAPDYIICGHWPAMMLPLKPKQPLIIDLAGPHLLERHYQGAGEPVAAALAKLSAIATADYYIVSGPSQRRYFLSFILRANVDRPLDRIVTIPMPLDPHLPPRRSEASPDFPRYIFGGVFLPWQDPSWSLRSVARFLVTQGRGKLTLIGGEHPSYAVRTGSYGELFAELSQLPSVELKPLLPFDAFSRELSEAHVAVDLMAWNLERELAITIRSTTYLWAGLPVIYNDYADLGLLIRQYDAGWCIHPGDDASLERVLREISEMPELVAQKSHNAQLLAKREFSWDRAVLPLLRLLGAPLLRSLEDDIVLDLPEESNIVARRTQPLRQFFLCRKNGLTRVEVRVVRNDRIPPPRTALRLFILKARTTLRSRVELMSIEREVIAEDTFSSEELFSHDWLSLDLPPVANSAGETFMVELAPDDGSTEVRPCLVRASPYPLLGVFVGDELLERSALCLRTAVAHGALPSGD